MAEIDIKETEKKVQGGQTSNYEDIHRTRRSIPFKELSLTNLKKKISNLRNHKLIIGQNNDHEKTKLGIVNSKIKAEDLENVILKKAQIVDKLSDKIDYIGKEKYVSGRKISNHALKISEIMEPYFNIAISKKGVYRNNKLFNEDDYKNEKNIAPKFSDEVIEKTLNNKVNDNTNSVDLSSVDSKAAQATVNDVFEEEKNNLSNENIQNALDDYFKNAVNSNDKDEKVRIDGESDIYNLSSNAGSLNENMNIFKRETANSTEINEDNQIRDIPVIANDRDSTNKEEVTKAIEEYKNTVNELEKAKADEDVVKMSELENKLGQVEENIADYSNKLIEPDKVELNENFSKSKKKVSEPEKEEKELNFDLSDTTKEDIKNALEKVDTKSGLEALKKRASEIAEETRKAEQSRIEATNNRDRAQNIKDKAQNDQDKVLEEYNNILIQYQQKILEDEKYNKLYEDDTEKIREEAAKITEEADKISKETARKKEEIAYMLKAIHGDTENEFVKSKNVR